MSIPEYFFITESSGQMNYLNQLFNFEEFKPDSSGLYTFRLIQSEKGSFISNKFGYMYATYDSLQDKIVNLNLVDKDKIVDEDSALWLINENNDGTVIIRNRKNPDLAWASFQGEFPFSRAVVTQVDTGDANQLLRIIAAS